MISWTDWPARRRPRRALFAGTVVIVSVGLAASLDPVVGFVGALLLLASVRDGLFPTRFRLTDHGVEVRNPLRMRAQDWDGFGGWAHQGEVFTLFGRGRSAALRRRRAVFLRRPERPTAVAALLRERLGEPEAS